MAAFSSILIGVGLAAGAVGIGMQAYTQSKMANEQKKIAQRQENVRQQQNQLDAMRRRRQAFRESQQARAQAISQGANQGAIYGSGVVAGAGNAITTGNQNQQTVNAASGLSATQFDLSRQYASVTAAGQQGMAWGGALSSLGGMMVQNAGTFARVGGNFGGGRAESSASQTYYG